MSAVAATTVPVVVLGAGAAGLMAALFAARAGAEVLLLEGQANPGLKIRISGGGRCNVLPSRVDLADFHTSGSAAALRNVLFSWPLADVHRFFEQDLGVPLKVEATGKVFPCSDRSRDVVEALLGACRDAGVTLRTGQRVIDLAPGDDGLDLTLATGPSVRARRLVLCTGGLSVPKSGSDGAGYAFLERLGHPLVPRHPALVPLQSEARDFADLAGLALPVELTAVRGDRELERRTGDFLFTHKGFSGPVVLDLSRHLTGPSADGVRLRVRWGADAVPPWAEVLGPRAGAQDVGPVVRAHLPRRLADALLHLAGVAPDRRVGGLLRDERRRLLRVLEACELPVSGDEGYRTAEVTAGGLPLAEVQLKTLESRRVPGLHVAGEALDVTGRLGGYNFLWAWVSGRVAGLGAARAGRDPG